MDQLQKEWVFTKSNKWTFYDESAEIEGNALEMNVSFTVYTTFLKPSDKSQSQSSRKYQSFSTEGTPPLLVRINDDVQSNKDHEQFTTTGKWVREVEREGDIECSFKNKDRSRAFTTPISQLKTKNKYHFSFEFSFWSVEYDDDDATTDR